MPGHTADTCGLVDSSLVGKERQRALQAIWGRANKDRRLEATRKYRKAHPDRTKISANKSSEKLRAEILNHYGGKCACCGFNDLTKKLHGKSFLNIDHIDGFGREHKREIGFKNFYQWLKHQNFPEGFRVLCRGCNNSMEYGENKCLLHK